MSAMKPSLSDPKQRHLVNGCFSKRYIPVDTLSLEERQERILQNLGLLEVKAEEIFQELQRREQVRRDVPIFDGLTETPNLENTQEGKIQEHSLGEAAAVTPHQYDDAPNARDDEQRASENAEVLRKNEEEEKQKQEEERQKEEKRRKDEQLAEKKRKQEEKEEDRKRQEEQLRKQEEDEKASKRKEAERKRTEAHETEKAELAASQKQVQAAEQAALRKLEAENALAELKEAELSKVSAREGQQGEASSSIVDSIEQSSEQVGRDFEESARDEETRTAANLRGEGEANQPGGEEEKQTDLLTRRRAEIEQAEKSALLELESAKTLEALKKEELQKLSERQGEAASQKAHAEEVKPPEKPEEQKETQIVAEPKQQSNLGEANQAGQSQPAVAQLEPEKVLSEAEERERLLKKIAEHKAKQEASNQAAAPVAPQQPTAQESASPVVPAEPQVLTEEEERVLLFAKIAQHKARASAESAEALPTAQPPAVETQSQAPPRPVKGLASSPSSPFRPLNAEPFQAPLSPIPPQRAPTGDDDERPPSPGTEEVMNILAAVEPATLETYHHTILSEDRLTQPSPFERTVDEELADIDEVLTSLELDPSARPPSRHDSLRLRSESLKALQRLSIPVTLRLCSICDEPCDPDNTHIENDFSFHPGCYSTFLAAEEAKAEREQAARLEKERARDEEIARLEELRGLDQELALKQQMKLALDPDYVLAAQEWIEDMTGEAIYGDFFTQLQDGARLCAVLNRIQPGLVPRYSPQPKNIWEQKANIELYLTGCRNLGVTGADLFLVPDLLKKKSFNEVLQNIYAVGGIAQRYPTYASRRPGKFGTLKIDLIVSQNKRRAEMAVAVAKAREEEEERRERLRQLRELHPEQFPEEEVVMRAGKEIYGFDKDLELKFRKEFSQEELQLCATWITKLTGRPVRFSSLVEFGQDLKTGETLCHLLNKIRPGTVAKVHALPNPLYHRENIEHYKKGCLSFGMAPADTFHTNDLYEEKYLPGVVKNIFALGTLVERSVKSFKGPHLVALRKDGKLRRPATNDPPPKGKGKGKEPSPAPQPQPQGVDENSPVADRIALFKAKEQQGGGEKTPLLGPGDRPGEEPVTKKRRCCCCIIL